MAMDRRAFLRTSALGVVAAAGWAGTAEPARAADDAGTLVPLSRRPLNYESVRSTFTTRITPLERFYLRNHFDIPDVDVGAWRLEVGGLVERPLSLGLADLERMPQATVEAVLQCAGNGRAFMRPRVPGVQWRVGACGNAEWTGVRLRDVLALARPRPGAAHLHVHGAERPLLATTPAFLRAIPMAKAQHPDTLLALRMNGKPIPPYHGRPLRLVAPGWVADDWIKWLTTIELRAEEPKGFFYDTGYRFPVKPGPPGAAVPPQQTVPMTRLTVKSILGSVADGAVLRPGRHDVVGVAFSGEAGIVAVEVSFDGGGTWRFAALEGPSTPYGFRVFRTRWSAEPGRRVICSRATDSEDAVQPDAPVWNPSGYLGNGVDRVEVEVRA